MNEATERPARRRSDLPVRIVSGVVMIVVAIAALAVGGTWFFLLVAAAALAIAAEWAGLMGADRSGIALTVAGAAAPMVALATPHVNISRLEVTGMVLVAALLVAVLGWSLRLAAGVLYATLPVLALVFLRDQYNGITLALWTLAIVWATDIGAYFAGRAIGGPKLAPALSPNKTWAGLIGGMLSALLIGLLLAWVFNLSFRLASLAALLAVAAQMGDLFESWLKRRAGVKDSGRLLPGHGGVMDRLDGALPVVIIVAMLIMAGFI